MHSKLVIKYTCEARVLCSHKYTCFTIILEHCEPNEDHLIHFLLYFLKSLYNYLD